MKKIFFVIALAIVGCAVAFAEPTDTQIRDSATTLEVPYADLKAFVDSYRRAAPAVVVPVPTVTVDSVKLAQDYRVSTSTADRNYKLKVLSVTGPISSINAASSYVDLTGEGRRNIRVVLTASEVSKLGSLAVGQRITVIGTGNGESGGNVTLINSFIQ
ncbi:hypothetical protein FACS1894151_08940 [Spirochaetia bacterium]|nr:hypothetical protein FACS1894151_08940 [Spirochaetia bacterium]